jgi:Spy/CpxP family protein refolding chaperone
MTMNRVTLALVLSLALNAGVIGAIAYSALQQGKWPAILHSDKGEADLPTYLQLDAEQRRRWQGLENSFLGELKTGWRQIRTHREQMIGEIFSEAPDRTRIEAERAAIAQLQSLQQRRIIEQLLREREVLDPEQRRKLADLLLRQAPAATFEERLHGR